MFIEKNISSSVIEEINRLITSNIFEDRSEKTCTYHGFQTPNIVNLFNENLLKRILPIKNYYKEVAVARYFQEDRATPLPIILSLDGLNPSLIKLS